MPAAVTQRAISFKFKNVFITGGSGFLGSTLIQTLCACSKNDTLSINVIVRSETARNKLKDYPNINLIDCDLSNVDQ
jgi:nucleoside-diphosphate-sugar epimerase